jgi:ClpP class serine protease
MSELQPDIQSTEPAGEIVQSGGDLDNLPVSTKTPFFQAVHALRYQRQALIHRTQERTRRKLICYISGSGASIDRDDTIGFGDLLHSVPPNRDLDLMLQTGGGDIDAAEKLISMVRKHVGTSTLRIIVPDYAKSAGTLIALGADYIVMSDTSELGPIDPQVILSDGNGNRIRHSVQSYLDAYKTHSETLKRDPNDIAARIMIQKLDPATVQQFQVIMIRARKLAENQLQHWMFRNGGNFTQAAAELIDTTRWQSHGQMISWEDAQDPKIGLKVEYQQPQSPEWQEYWQLYCLQRLAIQDNQKLFESDHVSLTIDGHR